MEATYVLPEGEFDEVRLGYLNQYYNPGTIELLRKAGVFEGASFCEIGCGHGGMLGHIRSMIGKAGTLYAVDASQEQLNITQQKVNDPDIQYRHTSLYDMSFEQPLDFIYARFVITHLAEPVEAIEKLLSCLKPGGKLILCLGDLRTHRFSPEDNISKLWVDRCFELAEINRCSYGFTDYAYQAISKMDVDIEHFALDLPISGDKEAKLLFYLGLQSILPQLVSTMGLDEATLKKELEAFIPHIEDPSICVSLFRALHFVLRK